MASLAKKSPFSTPSHNYRATWKRAKASFFGTKCLITMHSLCNTPAIQLASIGDVLASSAAVNSREDKKVCRVKKAHLLIINTFDVQWHTCVRVASLFRLMEIARIFAYWEKTHWSKRTIDNVPWSGSKSDPHLVIQRPRRSCEANDSTGCAESEWRDRNRSLVLYSTLR